MIRYVYIEHYGYYWRLSLNEFRQLCEGIISGEGYDLGGNVKPSAGLGVWLRNIPRCCYKQRWMKSASSADPERPLFHPLDWTPENARFYLTEVFGEAVANYS
jgi:hypothetical protein